MSTLKVNTLEEATVGGATFYTAKAWVNFNGTGTVAIRDGGNVSSITDNGTSNYTVNFTSSMASSNYAALATVGTASNFAELETLLTSSVYFRTPSRGSAFPDSDLVCVGVLT